MSVQIISMDVHLMQHVPTIMVVTHASVYMVLAVMASLVLILVSNRF